MSGKSGRETKVRRDYAQESIAGPELYVDIESRGGQQVHVDVAEAFSHQLSIFDEKERLEQRYMLMKMVRPHRRVDKNHDDLRRRGRLSRGSVPPSRASLLAFSRAMVLVEIDGRSHASHDASRDAR
jgi:hypothetical protein